MKREVYLTFLILTCFFRLSFSQIDSFTYESSNTLLIDGGIQSLEGVGIDQSATGQIGFRREDFFGRFEIKFTAASSLSESTASSEIRDYSTLNLNPNNTKRGLDAFHFSFYRRHYNRKGAVVNHARFLSGEDELTTEEFDEIIEKYELLDKKGFVFKLGYLIDLNVSNISWSNLIDSTSLDGNIIALNPYVVYSYRTTFLNNDVEVIGGLGPSLRIIGGDMAGQDDFINGVIGVDDKLFLGGQFTVQAFIDNFYAKAQYAIYNSESDIEGFTNGQFFASIGLQAKIGQVKKRITSLERLMRGDIKDLVLFNMN